MGWNKIEIYNVYMLGCILGEGDGIGTGGICPPCYIVPPQGSLSCLVSLFWHPGLCPDFVKPQHTLPPLDKISKYSTDIHIIYMHEVNIGYHGLSLTLLSFLLWKDPQNCIKYVLWFSQQRVPRTSPWPWLVMSVKPKWLKATWQCTSMNTVVTIQYSFIAALVHSAPFIIAWLI